MTSLLRERWRSRTLVGDAKPALIVRLRPGFMMRGYLDRRRIDNNSPIYPPLIWKGNNHSCWKGSWTPTGPWRELPHIVNVKWSRNFNIQTGQGTTTATILMDNIEFVEEEGISGLYHVRDRGYFSPLRGVALAGRANPWPQDAQNAWRNVLNSGWQIEVWEGYGQGDDIVLKTVLDGNHSYAPDSGALDRTYTGIVLDCETESIPDKITITCQDFGIFFTDQRVAGDNKAREIPSPVTFADRKRTEGETRITGPYSTSSGAIGADGEWTSGPDGADTDHEYIELTLPHGYYEEFFLAPEFQGMTMYVSVYCNGDGSLDRVHPLTLGWVTLMGTGTGTYAGIPYIRTGTPAVSPARRWSLGHGFNLPDGSKLRLTFTNLREVSGSYFAGVDKFLAYRFGTDPLNPPPGTPPVNAKGWILVEDAAEVIRMIFIWAGFAEWHVEDFGWSLYQPLVFGSDKFFIDVITDMLQQGAFVFYMGPPTNDDRSIGVPHFEHEAAIDGPAADMIQVSDVTLTETIQASWKLADLPHVMRYRGAITKTGGHELFGFGVGGLTRRYQATYYPPWSSNWNGLQRDLTDSIFRPVKGIQRTANIMRHFTETMGVSIITQLQSDAECLFACILAAIQYALGMYGGQFQMPGLSRLGLNDQMSVQDRASAINSRMWVVSIDSEHVTGGGESPGYWRMTVGGSFVDSQEMDALLEDYKYAWNLNQRSKASFA